MIVMGCVIVLCSVWFCLFCIIVNCVVLCSSLMVLLLLIEVSIKVFEGLI